MRRGIFEHAKIPMNMNLLIGIFALFFGFIGTALIAEEKPEAILAAARKFSDNSSPDVTNEPRMKTDRRSSLALIFAPQIFLRSR